MSINLKSGNSQQQQKHFFVLIFSRKLNDCLSRLPKRRRKWEMPK